MFFLAIKPTQRSFGDLTKIFSRLVTNNADTVFASFFGYFSNDLTKVPLNQVLQALLSINCIVNLASKPLIRSNMLKLLNFGLSVIVHFLIQVKSVVEI